VAGVASGTIIDNGYYELIFAGGTSLGAVASGGATESVNGYASGALIEAFGYEFLASGGTASATQMQSGAIVYVASGGTAIGTVNSGGTDEVIGLVSGTVLSGGGEQLLLGGTAVGTIVANGGVDVEEGVASGTKVLPGGFDFVAAGTAIGTIVSGGVAFFASGATISGATISGGTLELASGVIIGSGAITFSSGGELELSDSHDFHGLVAGFKVPDSIDLADIPYVSSGAGATRMSWTQLTSGASASGTLTVSENGHTANITLLGQYVAGNFHIQTDGAGGTLVTDPPLVATDATPVLLTNPRHT
jgi:autotransporter passenger strand-loop-strand repeat protein